MSGYKKLVRMVQVTVDKFVKRSNWRWLSKKLHMRGAHFLFDFGVLGVRRNQIKNVATKQMKNFYDAIKRYFFLFAHESRSPTVRLNTGAPGLESFESTQK